MLGRRRDRSCDSVDGGIEGKGGNSRCARRDGRGYMTERKNKGKFQGIDQENDQPEAHKRLGGGKTRTSRT